MTHATTFHYTCFLVLKTLLVFWPKGATMNVMLKADFADGIRTAEGLVDAELSDNNNNNNNSSNSQGGRGTRAVSKVVNYYCSTVTAVAAPPAPARYYRQRWPAPSCDQLPHVLALCCRLGGKAGALCAQRALTALGTVGGVTTEKCAATVAATVGSLGWTAVGEAVLAAVRSTQLANLESAAALALKLSSLKPDKRCSGTTAAAATAAGTTATVAAAAATAVTAEQYVKLELTAVKQEQAAVAPAATVKSELTAAVKSELTLSAVKVEPVVKAEPADTVRTATAVDTAQVQDGAELVGRYVAALGLGLPIVDATAAAGSSTAAADDDDVAVVGVAARHSLRTLTLPQAQALVTMLVTLATPLGGAGGAAAPVRCGDELVSYDSLTLYVRACVIACYGSCTCSCCNKIVFNTSSSGSHMCVHLSFA
jgi:hypothetical protein